jgi:hypothetical protein
MTTINQPYHLIESFLDPEYCKYLADYFINNMEEDRREHYGTFGIDGNEYFFAENKPKPKEYDPEMKLYDAVHFAYNFFKENYEIVGDFELNRSHANFMFPEAELHSHHDDRAGSTPIEEIGSRTYVCGIFLTDDYEGGEITFDDYEIALKPKPGSLLMFPGFSSRHGVNKVTSGLRLNILIDFFDVIDRNKINPDYLID